MTDLQVYATGAIKGIPVEIYWILMAIFCFGTGLLLWRKGLKEGLRYSTMLLLAEWVIVILCTTVFFRESGDEMRINLIPLSSYFDIPENSYLMEVTAINILNVVLFVPVGFLLVSGFRKMTWQRALVIGALLSFSIELLQLILRRGLCETDDVIHNVIGCAIGYGIITLTKDVNLNLDINLDQVRSDK